MRGGGDMAAETDKECLRLRRGYKAGRRPSARVRRARHPQRPPFGRIWAHELRPYVPDSSQLYVPFTAEDIMGLSRNDV